MKRLYFVASSRRKDVFFRIRHGTLIPTAKQVIYWDILGGWVGV